MRTVPLTPVHPIDAVAGAVVAAFPALPSSSRVEIAGVLLAGILLAEALSSLAPKEEGTDGSWLLQDLPQHARLPFVLAWLAAGGAWLAWMVLALGPSIVQTVRASRRDALGEPSRVVTALTLLLAAHYLLGMARTCGSLFGGIRQLLELARGRWGRKGD